MTALKKDVAEKIREFVERGGSLFAMCGATETLELAIADAMSTSRKASSTCTASISCCPKRRSTNRSRCCRASTAAR